MALITYDEYLAHFGTKGMKWGVRKDSSGKVSFSQQGTKLKGKERTAAIKAARQRQSERASKYNQKLDKAVEDASNLQLKAEALRSPSAKAKMQRVADKGFEKATQLEMTSRVKLLTQPDARVAAQSTRGEKAALGVLAGITGAYVAALVTVTH